MNTNNQISENVIRRLQRISFRKQSIFVFICVASVFVTTSDLQAQNGDSKDSPGEVQIAPVPPEKIPPAPVLSGEDALKSFKLAPGFRIELVAAEPLVHDPVAITFGPDGKIWVVEMSGYMPNADGIGEDQPVGKIATLEDTDGDGKMDKRTVFLDGLVMPRALALVRDGLLVAEPPHLWFCRDTDGDGKSDSKTEVAKDYGDQKSPEHTANGLMWALDNWIYSADTTVRFRSGEEDWQREPTTFRGQFGISQDDFGRIVYNANSDQFRIDLVPSKYLQRNPNYRSAAGLNVDPIRNQTVWPIRVTPGVNRGYRKGTLREDGTLEKFTAACSPLIYRGDQFPAEFYGNAFVCEPSAHLIKRNILQEENGVMTGKHAYANSEFLASTDERFRPVNLNNGPDGALYIVDMYRGILQHRIFLTSYLRAQSESRGLEKPIGLGRIYRVVADGKTPKAVNLARATSAELVANLSHANGWVRDTAQRLLVERNEAKTISLLQTKATTDTNFLGRIHALWTLDGIGQTDKPTLMAALKAEHPKVRATAIRLAETSALRTVDGTSYLERFSEMAANDLNPDVQLQLAFSLGEVAQEKGAEQGMLTIAKSSSANVYVREALLTGLHKRELEFLEKLLGDKSWNESKPGRAEMLSGLAGCIFKDRKTDRVNRLFEIATKSQPWQRVAMLDGIIVSAPISKGKNVPAPKPLVFPSQPDGLITLGKTPDSVVAGLLKQISALVTWPGQPGYVAPPKIIPLTSEQQAQFAAGRDLFAVSCAACHQLTGFGMEGLAPPLAESEWVLGSPERLTRILLHGVRGPLNVKGKVWDMEMPGLGIFDDEQLASLLTYIRREWEHGATPINAATVKKVRDANTSRIEAWTEAELLKIR